MGRAFRHLVVERHPMKLGPSIAYFSFRFELIAGFVSQVGNGASNGLPTVKGPITITGTDRVRDAVVVLQDSRG